jgi:hypothetical protein
VKDKRNILKEIDKTPEPELVVESPVDIANVRNQIANAVGGRAVQIVKTMIAAAEKGHYLAMKYLFEMTGLYPATTAVENMEKDSLARILLRNLELPEYVVETQTKVSEDTPVGSA